MFDVFLLAIQEFCKANNLDYEKVKTSPRCGNNNVLFIQRANNASSSAGLLDESPAEILLTARKGADGIVIEKRENTDKYLSI
jgi:hypothetical protein|nr:MAG TPA: hypothetical protein [Bacteriophage sp.]